MVKKSSVTVWINGKKAKKDQTDHPDEPYNISDFKKEHAAAIEESDNEVPTHIRRYSDQEPQFTGKLGFRKLKPIIMAALSAAVIGSFLGFFMLNMFVDIDTGMNAQGPSVPAAAEDSSDKKDNNGNSAGQEAGSSFTIEAKQAYVLQAGKFDSGENAEKLAAAFRDEGFSPMIWVKDDFHYVLAGLGNSEEQAKQLAASFSSKLLEVYVKEWNTPSFETKLSAAEKEWFQAFEKQWSDSLIGLSRQETVTKDDWKDLIGNTPSDTNHVNALTDTLTKIFEDLNTPTKWEGQQVLLNLWYQTMSLK
ncbi:SPOR domain-containing protein [Virgibacillus kekensis]|uniref:SPOR domain-containing protein n=1 Tax=Virgibacillus kekensis TaxID=202261 RepID=A0ABV9DJC6_9BACI